MKNSVIPKIDDKYLWWPGKDEGQPAPPIVWFNESDEKPMDIIELMTNLRN